MKRIYKFINKYKWYYFLTIDLLITLIVTFKLTHKIYFVVFFFDKHAIYLLSLIGFFYIIESIKIKNEKNNKNK